VGVAIYGLAFGLLAAQASFSELQIGIMGTLVLGGSSQIILVERLAAGAGAAAAVIAALALNLRLFLLTASIRDIFVNRSWWQVLLGAHLTTDENWALTIAKRTAGSNAGYWYLVGSGLCILIVWVAATVLGVFFASAIPEPRALGMDFAFTAAFIAIACSMWQGRRDLTPWLASFVAVLIILAVGVLDKSWAIVLGGVIGAAVAAGLSHD
jgi:4-azaleucine resistance transporter AzlC